MKPAMRRLEIWLAESPLRGGLAEGKRPEESLGRMAMIAARRDGTGFGVTLVELTDAGIQPVNGDWTEVIPALVEALDKLPGAGQEVSQ